MPAETLEQPRPLPVPPAERTLDETGERTLTHAARVVAVVPCHNRPDDVAALLQDLDACSRRWSHGTLSLQVILVDNASVPPLAALPTPRGLQVDLVRSNRNTGGSGGFSLGLDAALARELDFVWLVDSDARVAPETLSALVGALTHHPGLVAVGPAIADPTTGQVFELGGRVHRRSGAFEPCINGAIGVRELVACDYLASCCALVRADAARLAGAFPDRFINADDVEWCIRLAQRTRGQIAAVPWARAWHPRFSRFPTWTRYYTTRNALAPVAALGLGRRPRLRRAFADAARAAHQTLLGRHDLARLHSTGLTDLSAGRVTGPASDATITFEPSHPLEELPDALHTLALNTRQSLHQARPPTRLRDIGGLLARTLLPWTRTPVAVTPARGSISDIFRGRRQILIDDQGWVERSPTPIRDALSALRVFAHASWAAWRASGTHHNGPSAPDISAIASRIDLHQLTRASSLDIIVLSYKRPDALLRTLDTLSRDALIHTGRGEHTLTLTVIDNASNDTTLDQVRARFPDVRIISLDDNLGVEAFNRAARSSHANALLILDDDAAPAPGSLTIALQALLDQPNLAAVALHPRHPRTGESEWPFGTCASDSWPVMGCANLVRRSAWERVGGYEPAFFLYRNDMDLALKLLAAGYNVRFDPHLLAWHDTPAGPGNLKSPRWHELATRNWIWMARRHARGLSLAIGVLAGWLWAHKAAKLDKQRHRATLRGLVFGLASRPPLWKCDSPHTQQPPGTPWRIYLRLRILGR